MEISPSKTDMHILKTDQINPQTENGDPMSHQGDSIETVQKRLEGEDLMN